ncbi:MAG TPA: arsenite methyltransferase [Oscillospiraceae bacterium]|nr:arsenite methyltransferase [Oscillospiraceae bacterium]HPS34366.1 arsenite methyltransferase [Oscillospiraceae bacterium]
MSGKEETREQIRKKYSKIALKGGEDCGCSSGCCGAKPRLDVKEITKNLGYSDDDLSNMPNQVNMGLGCGNPLAIASLKEGETVLDLGSGGGFDCFLARRKVGESGHVIGIDMTPEMIKLSRENARKSKVANVEFRLGEIEHMPVADGVVDVIISNCVINLSVEKEKVFKEAYRVLKTGGRICVSDVVATAELPEELKKNIAMLTGCIAGAEYVENLRAMLTNAGFKNIRMTPKDNSREILSSWAPGKGVENYVASYIIEAEK